MFFSSHNTLRLIILISTLFIASSVSTFAYSKVDDKSKAETLPPVNDGPYVFVNEHEQLESYWLCQGDVITRTNEAVNFPLSMSACDMPANIHALNSIENKVLEFSGDYPVAALSDFHGKYDLMIELLMNNKIIDKSKHWAFGKGHFVITGDIFDRGDKVTEILWFLYDLERQAHQAGGDIHLTLGNHEVMILNGDLRYLHPKYVETAKRLNKPFEQLFSQNSIIGRLAT